MFAYQNKSRISNKFKIHYTIDSNRFVPTFDLNSSSASICVPLQAGGAPPRADAPPRQHPAGAAPPAAAMRPKGFRWAGARAAAPGAAAAKVPHRHLQVCVHTPAKHAKAFVAKACVFEPWSSGVKSLVGFVFPQEPLQRGGDRHLLLHQSHHYHDDALHSAGRH